MKHIDPRLLKPTLVNHHPDQYIMFQDPNNLALDFQDSMFNKQEPSCSKTLWATKTTSCQLVGEGED